MITLENLYKTYPTDREHSVHAVAGVNLSIPAGDFIVITGHSGSGKTTLLNLISGLTPPTSGRVLWDSLDIWDLPDAGRSRLRSQHIGFVFQFPSLLSFLTVLENLLLPLTFAGKESGEAAQDQASQLLQSVGLEEKINLFPRQLSIGEQQRVTIARALINQPDSLLADEPTSNLDEQTEKEILALLGEIHLSRKITILMVTHSALVLPIHYRILRMAAGVLVSEKED
jgi:ABC-type lipoprotein export system ATPase subunit